MEDRVKITFLLDYAGRSLLNICNTLTEEGEQHIHFEPKWNVVYERSLILECSNHTKILSFVTNLRMKLQNLTIRIYKMNFLETIICGIDSEQLRGRSLRGAEV